MFKFAIATAAVLGSASAERERKSELVLQSEEEVGEVVISKRPHEYIKVNIL